jgi:hypothetical protein
MTMFVLVLNACAPAVGPASNTAPNAGLIAPPPPPGCLDLEGQRELLAGVELEKGAYAAEIARCNIQRGAAVKYGDGQAQRATAAEGQLRWAIPVTGVGGVVLGALVAGLVVWASQPKTAAAGSQ